MMPWTLPQAWTDYGARWGHDGLLYLAEWRRGFEVHELRAMFFTCQQVRVLENDLRRARAELDALTHQLETAERTAAFYRRQVGLEARLGLALSRIAV